MVAYLRVSTDRQGKSGLGLEAQRAAVAQFLAGQKPIAEFVEVESGRRADRPELAKALRYARDRGAALIVAKVDRLTRSVKFLHQVLDAGAEIRFVDLPQIEGPAGKFMLNQMAAVAELEAGLISQRTKAALAAAKARGVALGMPSNLTRSHRAKGRLLGAQARREAAVHFAIEKAEVIAELRGQGVKSWRGMAAALNEAGVLPPSGGKWYDVTVKRVVDRVSKSTRGATHAS